jgi:hypothetical protein
VACAQPHHFCRQCHLASRNTADNGQVLLKARHEPLNFRQGVGPINHTNNHQGRRLECRPKVIQGANRQQAKSGASQTAALNIASRLERVQPKRIAKIDRICHRVPFRRNGPTGKSNPCAKSGDVFPTAIR